MQLLIVLNVLWFFLHHDVYSVSVMVEYGHYLHCSGCCCYHGSGALCSGPLRRGGTVLRLGLSLKAARLSIQNILHGLMSWELYWSSILGYQAFRWTSGMFCGL